MFHWLRNIGGEIKDAYKHFRHYKGEQSYKEMQLDTPEPLPRDREDEEQSEWSHMSEYDDFGVAPSPKQDHMVLMDEDEDGRETNHVTIREDVEPKDESETTSTMGQRRTKTTTMQYVNERKVWHHQNQPYSVKEWNGQPKKDVNELTIRCMMAANDRPGYRRR